jgi:hypothetical protein
MTEPSEQSLYHQWWRWPLVPIAAIAGGIAGSLVLGTLNWLSLKFQGGFSEDGWWYRYMIPIITWGMFGWLYVQISCYVAPRGKFITGIVMTTLLFIFSFFGLWLTWHLEKYSTSQSIQLTVGTIASLIAAIVTLVHVHSENS